MESNRISSRAADNAQPDLSGPLFKVSVAMAVLPLVAIALRFWSRLVVLRSVSTRKRSLWWDDWVALVALPFSMTLCVLVAYRSMNGLGKPIDEVTLDQIVQELEFAYAGYLIDAMAISLPKISALLFYARVFSTGSDKVLRRVLWSVAVMTGLWLVAYIVSAIFQCIPVPMAWSLFRLLDSRCFDIGTWFVAEATLSVSLDLVILTIPLPILWKMQLSHLQRVMVTLAFIFGYCVILASIGRLVNVASFGPALDDNFTYTSVPFMYWVVAEASLSIVGVCLPSIFAMVRQVIKRGPKALYIPGYAPEIESEKYGTITTISSNGPHSRKGSADSAASASSFGRERQGSRAPLDVQAAAPVYLQPTVISPVFFQPGTAKLLPALPSTPAAALEV